MNYSLASNTWDEQEVEAIKSVIASERYTMGPHVKKFEEQFAQAMGAKHAVMVNSGSSANLLGIAALVLDPQNNIEPGDEVIVPAVSWSTTYFPVTQYGLKLVFVDIDKETLNINVDEIEQAITPRTKAIFAVNLLGNSCEYDKLLDICNKHNLLLLEDNCGALGADYNGKMLGTIGRVGTFSFFFSHHIQTMEGGMILTNDQRTEQYLRSLRAHGWIRDLPDENCIYNKTGNAFEDAFKFVLPGYNVRPLEMSGAIGCVQLTKMNKMIETRRKNYTYLSRLFLSNPNVMLQKEVGNASWFGFSLLLQNKLEGRRKEVIAKLQEASIESRPISGGNFINNPVAKYLNYEVRSKLTNANYVDENGFFVGNDCRDLKDNLVLLKTAIESIE
jgi:CDP-6-deoxy-D-xylo-4-hexulose-3-dehydrase